MVERRCQEATCLCNNGLMEVPALVADGIDLLWEHKSEPLFAEGRLVWERRQALVFYDSHANIYVGLLAGLSEPAWAFVSKSAYRLLEDMARSLTRGERNA